MALEAEVRDKETAEEPNEFDSLVHEQSAQLGLDISVDSWPSPIYTRANTSI